jgi:hypothetical protein
MFYTSASAPKMLLPFLAFALMSASAVSAAPVPPSASTSEPTKVTVMMAYISTIVSLGPSVDTDLKARQWEWTPSAPVWTEPAWTQPAWSDPTIAPVSTAPVWTSSLSYSYTEVTVPISTSTYSYHETHRPVSNGAKVGWITAMCIGVGLVGIPIIACICIYIRRYFYKRTHPAFSKDGLDIEGNASVQRDSQTPTPSTLRGTTADENADINNDFNPEPVRERDIVDASRLDESPDSSTSDPCRPAPAYKNNIPLQDTHWPIGEMETVVASIRTV